MRKFAKISAVLAAMVLALAFAGCSDGGSSSDDVTVGGSSSGSETGGSSGGSGSSSSGNSSGSGSSSSEDSSTKNILAGKTYYSIDFEEKEYTSESINKAKIRVSMFAFDSNGQKVKYTELAYDFENGAVDKNNDNIIESDECDYSVSGSTLTVKAPEGVGKDLIATIKSDGSIDGMKKLKGNLYAFAKAEADSEELSAVAYIIIVDGTACNLEQHTCSSKNGLDDPYVLGGTVSGSTLEFTDEKKDGQTVTVSCKLSDKEIKVNDSPDGPITLKRM
ncbi:hypothetical protein [Treponema succinifaciens]|uniref:Lipoprotein n=1 Tax=Treponema succinifaciens (strain ATCC 33096 / DSM 2489 / 6091) TaxID=869209 RepID=F2NXK5_TRES6|nr:hypothetical protein [Treponema succinifaciens]AEB15211.1 hypothetical protein Tresu_2348 [Treponema succinifaciens DSM 2489]